MRGVLEELRKLFHNYNYVEVSIITLHIAGQG